MKEFGYIFYADYLAAEFGQRAVLVKAESKEDAEVKFKEWCKKNYMSEGSRSFEMCQGEMVEIAQVGL